MEHELGSLRPKLVNSEYRRALKNPAVTHCQKTWERVYRAVLKEKGSVAVARLEASEAYQAALPLLVGDENIRDFIACVTFGFANGILYDDNTTKLLYAAQTALSAAGRRSRLKDTDPAPESASPPSQTPKLRRRLATPPPPPVEKSEIEPINC